MTDPIVRRSDFAGGGVTDDELAQMREHTKMWIARAMRTAPIDSQAITEAIKGLYQAADLAEPRVIIVLEMEERYDGTKTGYDR